MFANDRGPLGFRGFLRGDFPESIACVIGGVLLYCMYNWYCINGGASTSVGSRRTGPVWLSFTTPAGDL